MSSGQARRRRGAEASPPDEAAVASYLSEHPDFFERHPDLVASLRIPHGHAGTRSLVEHQMAVLRKQLDTERRRLNQLIARARDNEGLSARLHALVLELIASPDLSGVEAVLHGTLQRELKADAVTLKLFPLEEGAADPVRDAFLDFVDRRHALCGPLPPERHAMLFGGQPEAVESAAIVPIRATGLVGVLAIGSSDPARFRPEMGTELLDRLGEVVSQRLRTISCGDG